MKIEIRWTGNSPQGLAIAVEPCCDAMKSSIREFLVWRESDFIEAGLMRDEDEVCALPLRFCLSCGSPVEIIKEEEVDYRFSS